MEDLNYFYKNIPEIYKFIDRKKTIKSAKTIVCGAVNSGKSYILLDFLTNFAEDEVFYINCSDIRADINRIVDKLPAFLSLNKKIKIIVFDNLNIINDKIYNAIISLKTEFILISTRLNSFVIDNFEKLKIYPLDFEEFIAFDKKRNDLNSLISAFLIQGNGAKNPFLLQNEIVNFEQNLLKSNLNETEILIFKECADFIHSNFSANKIYTSLKEKIKISKDSIYSAVSKFQDQNLIHFIPKFQDENSVKKLYFSHFIMKDALTFKKEFQKKFANALFCELMVFEEPVYYTKELDFYIPSKNMGILIIPFSASEIIFLKFKKIFTELKKLKITKLNVISMANSGALELEGVKCEVVPFAQFALSF